MKTANLLVVSLLLSFFSYSQELTGFWTGKLSNDSTKKDHHFELALSEYRGKVTGYSYTTFISNDTFYYGIRRVKATREGDTWTIEDDKFVVNNFPERAAKKVGRTITFTMNKEDSTWNMNGEWKTNQTKKYYSIGGKIEMKEEKDIDNSTLAAHLEELDLQNTLPFYQEMKAEKEKKKAVYAHTQNNKPATAKVQQETKTENTIAKTSQNNVGGSSGIAGAGVNTKPEEQAKTSIPIPEKPVEEEKVVVKPQDKQIVKTEQNIDKSPTVTSSGKVVAPSAEAKAKANEIAKKDVIIPREEPKVSTTTYSQNIVQNEKKIDKPETVPQQAIAKVNDKPQQAIAKPEVKPEIKPSDISQANTKAATTETTPATTKKPVEAALPTTVAGRKIETIQQIYFKTDSLVLALYDNGVVDGDTVSVFVNGQNIIEKQKLKEAATKKTIYIPAGTDSIQLVLFAENLGTIPPNTGLLTVRDGEDVYQVRFSADMQKNAAIIFRRK